MLQLFMEEKKQWRFWSKGIQAKERERESGYDSKQGIQKSLV